MASEPVRYDAELATYNAEVARGIVHTDEWRQRMRLRRELFDHATAMDMRERGGIHMGDSGWVIPPQPRRLWRPRATQVAAVGVLAIVAATVVLALADMGLLR